MPKKLNAEDSVRTLHFRNLDFSVSRKYVKALFSRFGSIKRVIILYNKKAKTKTGTGFITFDHELSLKKALNALPGNFVLNRRTLAVCAKRTYQSDYEMATLQFNSDYEESPIGKLFPELLVHIFSFLPILERFKIERVCKKWNEAINMLWKSETTLNFSKMVNFKFAMQPDKVISKLITRCPNVRIINLRYEEVDPLNLSRYPGNVVIKAISDNCPKLQELYINNMSFLNPHLRPLAEKCPDLEKIEVPFRISEREVWWLFHFSKNLKYFKVTSNQRLRGHFFHVANPKMVSLELFQCTKLTTRGLSKMIQVCQDLQVLTLTESPNVTDDILKQLGNHLKGLRKLTLDSSGTQLTASSIYNLALLGKLEHLSLANIKVVNDNFISQLCSQCKNLKSLNVANTGVSNSSLAFLKRLQHLATLDISSLSITSIGLKGLAECSSLQELHVARCMTNLDEGVKAVIKCCSRLQLLDVCGTPLSYATIVQFAGEHVPARESPLTIYFERCHFPDSLEILPTDKLKIVKKIVCGECTQREYGGHDLDDDYFDSDSHSDIYDYYSDQEFDGYFENDYALHFEDFS